MRQIYTVDAKQVVPSAAHPEGVYSNVSGYPKTFDSRNYGGDTEKTLLRAKGEFHDTFGDMCKRDDRQLQTVILMTAAGQIVDRETIGKIADDPDPEPTPEPEPEE